GSTVMTFDPDADGDADVLLGDFSYETMLFLENGGNRNQAWITDQTSDFPSAADKIEVPYFPISFFLDVDHDGVNDLLVAPNQKDARENVTLSWFYSGSEKEDSSIEFNLIQTSFLNDQMLDFGTDATPLFFDYDADGRKDLLVGSRFNENYQIDHPSQLFLFRNTGTTGNPEFQLVNSDWLALSTFTDEIDALSPTCADIDDDGDLDLVIGNKRGKLILVENIGILNGPFEMGTVTYPWFDIDVGFSSVPVLQDLDGDNDLDLLLGEEKGNINFFRNMGSSQVPLFFPDVEMDVNVEEFGMIDARQNNAVFGMAAPTIVESQDTTFLLVGTAFGNILIYDISSVEPEEKLQPLSDHPLASLSEGNRSKPAFIDLDTDGYLDMALGTGRGGLTLWKTGFREGQFVSTYNHLLSEQISITPNPASNRISINLSQQPMQQVRIFSATGQMVRSWVGNESRIVLDVSQMSPGVYFTAVIAGNMTGIKTWIKI
ncbi:MAG: T9SS type A sorting domain-containing protein, partial [Saprospiraceae bacterium]|nr:T9SS type A sorting domain-containing protein [Saprospiraceae bacterium]